MMTGTARMGKKAKLLVGAALLLAAGGSGFGLCLVLARPGSAKPSWEGFDSARMFLDSAAKQYVRGDLKEAKATLDFYCQTHRDEPDMIHLLARILVETGRVSQASAVLKDAEPPAKGSRSEVDRAILEAAIARQGGDPEAAARILNGCLKVHPEEVRLWREFVFTCLQGSQFHHALSAAQQALKMDPKQEDLAKLCPRLSRAAMMQEQERLNEQGGPQARMAEQGPAGPHPGFAPDVAGRGMMSGPDFGGPRQRTSAFGPAFPPDVPDPRPRLPTIPGQPGVR